MVKASDITDKQVYQAIATIKRDKQQQVAFLWDIQEIFSEMPHKVVLAKLKTMVAKKRLEGCACGCRGDFQEVKK